MKADFYLTLSILLGIVFGVLGVLYLEHTQQLAVPVMPTRVEIEQPDSLPPSLDDIQVTVIRVGVDVTLLLDWGHTESRTPFHLWIEVDGSDVVLYSPNNELRTIEVVPDEILIFYGSTLYHELTENRLAIDLQVQKKE